MELKTDWKCVSITRKSYSPMVPRTKKISIQQYPSLIMDQDDPWPAQKLLLWFACSDRSHLQRIILVAFNTWYDGVGNCKKGKTKQKYAQQSIQYTGWPLGRNERISSPSISIVLLVLVSRRLPLPMLTDRSLLTGDDSCCCHCICIPREVCLNGSVSSQSVLFAVVPCCCRKIIS